MKNVLIIAAQYPPNATGAVMRVAKLVKYLPCFGWNPIVITSTLASDSQDLLKDVEKVNMVYHLPSCDIRIIYHSVMSCLEKMRKTFNFISACSREQQAINSSNSVPLSLSSRYLVPDHMIAWIPLSVIVGIILVLKYRLKVIYATSPLPSANLVAYGISKICRIRWVIDMRDPWTTNPFRAKRAFRFLEYLDQFLEKKVLESAHHIVVVAEEFIAPLLAKFPFLKESSFSVITNGYDPDDFRNIAPLVFDRFSIVHSGSFYGARSATPFLESLKLLVTCYPRARNMLQVLFVGALPSHISDEVSRMGLSEIVKQVGKVPHEISLKYIMGADLLLLIPGPGKSTMTGKIFEYLAAKKPILLIGEEDSAASKLVSSTGRGAVVPPENVSGIMEYILSFLKRNSSFSATPLYNSAGKYVDHLYFKYQVPEKHSYSVAASLMDQYDRREIARRISEILEKAML